MASKPSKSCEFDCIEIPLRKFFYNYGRLVGRNPAPFILAPILFTLICLFGFLFENRVEDAIYLYTPTDGPSKYEMQILNEKFPLVDRKFQPDRVYTEKQQASVIVTAADGGGILRNETMAAVEDVNNFVQAISVFTRGQEYAYRDICLRTDFDDCYHNEVATYSFALFKLNASKLTYPQTVVPFTNIKVYLASTFGGVEIINGTDIMANATAVYLLYQLRYDPPYNEIGPLWESQFQSAMANYRHDAIDITYVHSNSLSQELSKNAGVLMPKFSITFVILVGYSILVNLTWFCGLPPAVDWTTSKPLLALGGVINAGMGVTAAIGFLRLCNFYFNEIVAVVPFLLVPICVEYMFLMTAAWRRTNRTLPVDERLGESVSIHAVSILISMLTGALAFGVGAITTIPAVHIFSIYACVSMFITLVFQFTFFVGLLALFGHLEHKQRHCLFISENVVPVLIARQKYLTGGSMSVSNIIEKYCLLGSVPDYRRKTALVNYSTSIVDRFFEFWYAPFLMKPLTKLCVMILLGAYLGLAGYGCSRLKEGLKPANLLVGNSYAIPHYLSIEEHMWPQGQQVHIVVNNAKDTDMATPEGREDIYRMVNEFADSKHGMGNSSVTFFLDDFTDYLRRNYLSTDWKRRRRVFYQILYEDFLKLNAFVQWRADIVWGNVSEYEILSYRFLVGLKDFKTTNDHRSAMETMREVASKFPDQNITTFYLLWQFGDQFRKILPNTIENVLIALVLMVAVSVILIPHPICSLCVALAIASIDVGVVGYMTLWGVNLDAISMITIVMSVGFSVDFTAHVSYGYVALSKESDPVKRMQIVLGARSWPIVEAGSATVLGILALAIDLKAYVVITFFKTVFLVMVIGMIHALVFLPVVLDLFIRPVLACSGNTNKIAATVESSIPHPATESMELNESLEATMPSSKIGVENGHQHPSSNGVHPT